MRPATPGDAGVIVAFIEDLATYENLRDECHADPAALAGHLFGERPVAEVLIAEIGGDPVGFALYFGTYSTFLTRPGLWLEDLFVTPQHRGTGVGRALLAAVAQVALERGCGRVEWAVLDWNTPAIEFYTGFGARLMDGWTICRTEGSDIAALACP